MNLIRINLMPVNHPAQLINCLIDPASGKGQVQWKESGAQADCTPTAA